MDKLFIVKIIYAFVTCVLAVLIVNELVKINVKKVFKENGLTDVKSRLDDFDKGLLIALKFVAEEKIKLLAEKGGFDLSEMLGLKKPSETKKATTKKPATKKVTKK